VKHFSCVSLLDMLLALQTNIKIGWKGLPRANTLAYFEDSYVNVGHKNFVTLGPEVSRIKNLPSGKIS